MKYRETQLLSEKPRTPGRLFLPSLVSSSAATMPPTMLAGLLLIDIGRTFGRSVGVTGQIQTVASLVGAITAVLMGIWSVRFNHKSLLTMGLFFFSISAIGCSFASNFTMILIAFSLTGLGGAMVSPMIYTLIATHLPLEKRAHGIGWVLTGSALIYLFGAPVSSALAEVGGWNLAFLGFALPSALLSLVMVMKEVPAPSRSRSLHPLKNTGQYVEGFKEVFANRSATVCLICIVLLSAVWQAIVLYGVSFFRERFLISTGFASILLVGIPVWYMVGTLVSGRMVNRFGRKPVTFFTLVVFCIYIVSFTNVLYLWLALALMWLGCLFGGMMDTAVSSLTLEQVQRFRGTMMSLNSAASNMGIALGAGVGGLALLRWDYEGVGLALGALGIAAAILFYFLVSDPTRTRIKTVEPDNCGSL
ncbi:MAG: MFS transporter [Candidatus Heimdallarchaeota archaeon]